LEAEVHRAFGYLGDLGDQKSYIRVHAGGRSLFLAFAAGAGEQTKKTPFFSQNEERRQERGSISSAAGLSVDHIAFTSD
jgi:hypothetical protein